MKRYYYCLTSQVRLSDCCASRPVAKVGNFVRLVFYVFLGQVLRAPARLAVVAQPAMEIWPALISAIVIGLIAVSLGFGLIYRGTTLSASPIVLCSVTGLMVGIAVLVILPEAVESMIELGWKCEHIFLLFLFPPLIMFFFEHVVVEHSHDIPGDFAGAPGAAHEHDESCRHQTPIPYAMKFSTDGSPVSVSERTPLKYGKSKEGSFDRLLEDCGCRQLLLRPARPPPYPIPSNHIPATS